MSLCSFCQLWQVFDLWDQNFIRTSLSDPLVQRAVQVTHCTLFPLKNKCKHKQSNTYIRLEIVTSENQQCHNRNLYVPANVKYSRCTSGSNTAPLYTGLAVVLLFLSCLLLWISGIKIVKSWCKEPFRYFYMIWSFSTSHSPSKWSCVTRPKDTIKASFWKRNNSFLIGGRLQHWMHHLWEPPRVPLGSLLSWAGEEAEEETREEWMKKGWSQQPSVLLHFQV